MAEKSLVCVSDFEKEAENRLPKSVLDYYRSGATGEVTLRANREAYSNWYIRPRFLRDVTDSSLSTTILGHKVEAPIGISPSAMQRMASPEGECANARAAHRASVPFTLSTIATSSIEEVAEATPNSFRFFQLYIYRDRETTHKLVQRAEKCGYSALVLTVDAPEFGIRWADQRNKFTLAPHLRMANFDMGDLKSNLVQQSKGGSGINEYVRSMFDPSLTWKDVMWLKSVTRLPLILKGILTAEDALKALEHGATAIWVSNHGARQVNGVPPAIDVLPEITAAVKGRCEIYFDGGVSEGTDVFKAIALGANMACIGRPALWGLACGGEDGVYSLLKILKEELQSAMMLSGCKTIADITREMVRHKSAYSKL